MSRRRGKPWGFTLVELLVVIAVIVILAAIILPVVNGATQRARMAQCSGNLHGLAVAMKLYRNEYKRYPNAALDRYWDNLNPPSGSYQPGLVDDTGQAAYTGTAYNTAAAGRKSRISALYPNFLEDQKSLVCPDDDGDSLLVLGSDGGNALNGQDPAVLLEVGGDGSASVYDELYNAFGYRMTGSVGDVTEPGAPIVDKTAQVQGGRKAPRLNNPYAPGNTIITYCREHEQYYNANATVSLIVRVDGKVDKVIRQQFNWQAQSEQVYD